jgi:hypothetical protein
MPTNLRSAFAGFARPAAPAALLAASLLSGSLAILPADEARAASFDGHWSVLIVTQKGDCDAAYRYEVRIAGGAVSYAGTGDFTASGRVNAGGGVNVSIRRGNQSANGSGRLRGNSGAGSWSGKSPTAACSGRWEAERR